MPLCLTLSIIRYGSRVKWNNPGKGVAAFTTPWCSSYRKGNLRVTSKYGHQLYFISHTKLELLILVATPHEITAARPLSAYLKNHIRRTRHALNCWRSKDEFISDALLWIPTHGRVNVGRPDKNLFTSILDIVWKTCRERVMIGTEGEREREIGGICAAAWLDDDKSMFTKWVDIIKSHLECTLFLHQWRENKN